MKTKRWKLAQRYEKEWWENHWKETKKQKKTPKLIKDYWNFHLNILKKFYHPRKNEKILEIGGGPNPFILYFPQGKKYVLDPLKDYYSSNFQLPKGIKWIKGIGEKIPFKENYFDTVICANTLDHVNNPKKVILEIKRILKKDGIVYFTIDCYNPLFKIYRILREKLNIGDKCHPHSFSIKDIRRLIHDSKLEINYVQEGIGDLGDYIDGKINLENKKSEKIKITKLRKMKRFFSNLITKSLILIGNIFLEEKGEKDFIFIISKK